MKVVLIIENNSHNLMEALQLWFESKDVKPTAIFDPDRYGNTAFNIYVSPDYEIAFVIEDINFHDYFRGVLVSLNGEKRTVEEILRYVLEYGSECEAIIDEERE